MFLPTISSLTISPATGPVSGTLSLSGINRNNSVVRVESIKSARVTLSFRGSGVSLDVNAEGAEIFRIPVAATDIDLYVSGPYTAIGSISVGENV